MAPDHHLGGPEDTRQMLAEELEHERRRAVATGRAPRTLYVVLAIALVAVLLAILLSR
jgi:hypothetical protein